MGMDVKRARRALKAAGARGPALCATAWPFGRERRLRTLARQRLAVLQAKNRVVDLLFRSQRPLADQRLLTLEHVERALKDPERRKLVVGVSASREVIEDEIGTRSDAEVGRSLTRALSELVAEGVLLRVPGKMVTSREDVYLAVQRGRRPRYDVGELNRLVREGRSYRTELRAKESSESATTAGRSYEL